MSGIRVEARNLDALIGRYRQTARENPAQMRQLIDKQLAQIKRVMVAATPVASREARAFRLPNGRVVTRQVAAHDAMRNRWHKQLQAFGGVVYNDAPYAVFLFTGTRPHAIPGAFGYPLPFGTSASFHPGTHADQRLIGAFRGEIANANARFAQFGLQIVGRLSGEAVR